MIWFKYNYEYTSKKHGRLLFNYLSGVFLDINDEEIFAQLEKIKEDPEKFDFSGDKELFSYLVDNGIICDRDETNEELLFYNNIRLRTQQSYKTLVIVPTLDCNLRCPYCYEGLNKPHTSMSREVIERVKHYIDTRIKKSETGLLGLLWYGGEALMAFDTICEITEYIKQKQIPFYGDLTTNGTLLTPDKLERFEELNIKQVQITFDGPREHHDKKRFFANNKGTFDLLIDRCKMLNQYVEKHKDFVVHLRINVDKSNKDGSVDLYKELKSSFPLLNVYVAPLKQYHGCSNQVDCFSGDEAVFDYLLSLYEDYGIDVVDYRSVLKGMRPCMAEMESSIIIGPSGEMYLCLNDVGDANEVVGNIMTEKLNMPLISKYRNARLTAYNEACNGCKIRWMCGGGCPESQYRNKYYGEHNEICTPLRKKRILNKYLDVRYDIQKGA